MKKIIFYFLMALIVLLNSHIFAQVTIGKLAPPDPSAVLQVIAPQSNKGILIPNLTKSQRDAIVKPANGLGIFNTDENCYNYYDSLQSSWTSLCGGTGAAKFSFLCDSIIVKGTYVVGIPVTGANYLAVLIDVTRSGSFTLLGNTSNGYSFAYSGTVTNIGKYFINVQALGTPNTAKIDNVTITGGADTCYTSVTVQTNVAEYSIDCGSISVAGQYVKGTLLTATNNITLRITVSSPGFYNISTPMTNGIAFTAQGSFASAGSQIITLYPTAGSKPSVNTNFPITIDANSSSGNVSCSATIPMTLPLMTYACIGSGAWSWAQGNPRTISLLNSATSGTAFGPNGLVKIKGLSQLWSATTAVQATTNLANNPKPDLILYFSYGASPDVNLSTALVNYVNAGGVLIFGTSDDQVVQAQTLLDGIFGSGVATASNTGSSTDYDYTINVNLVNDPIVNGPFGNLAGKYWGEDNSGTVYVTQMPSNSVQICSINNPLSPRQSLNPGYSVIWYNNSKNFIYFGDSSASTFTPNNTVDYPSLFDQTTGMPLSKLYGLWSSTTYGSGSVYVYNSILEFNAIAWALQKAAISGINPH